MRILRAALAGFLCVAGICAPSLAAERAGAGTLEVGGEFPGFVLPGVDGKEVALSDFRGKAILLSFWSCYTDTCFTAVRVIESLLQEYASQDLVAPTVCSEVPPALEKNDYSALLKRCSTGQVVLVDKDRKVTEGLGITEFPTTYLIDRDYTIWKVIQGIQPLMEEDFRALVRSLVTE